uniref:G protein-coupled receptor n=1 Tax=Parascaris univalens TaxID=6257 RepID=A0A915BN65_PARUN
MNFSIASITFHLYPQLCSYEKDGIICGACFTAADRLITTVAILPSFILTIFVLYLSIAHMERKDITNLCTLHIFIPLQLLNIVQCVEITLRYFECYGRRFSFALRLTDAASMFFGTLNLLTFRVLSVALLFSTYCSCRYPIIQKRFFGLNNWLKFLMIFDVMAVIFAVFTVIESALLTTSFIVATLHLILYITIIAVTIAAIRAVAVYFHRKRNMEGNRSNQLRLLLSTMLYALPPNILGLPSLPISISFVFICTNPSDQIAFAVYRKANLAQDILVQLRPIILALSTIIALPSYRKASLKIFALKQRIATIKRITLTTADSKV